jgi:hypothetical protein
MTSEVLTEARSRRAILAALGGGFAALVAQAISRPLPARALDGDVVNVGAPETGSTETSITVTGTAPAFRGQSAQGIGLKGVSSTASSAEATNTGVYGLAGAGTNAQDDTRQTGVYGFAEGNDLAGIGVWGDSAQAVGVVGTGGDTGVIGQGFWGVVGSGGEAEASAGVVATGNTGLWASTGTGAAGPIANTAVSADAEWPNNAAVFTGRTIFSRAGKVVVPAGTSFIYKAMPLAGTSLIFALVLSNRSGLWVQRAIKYPNASAPTGFRIYLNANVPMGTPGVYVSYFIVN